MSNYGRAFAFICILRKLISGRYSVILIILNLLIQLLVFLYIETNDVKSWPSEKTK